MIEGKKILQQADGKSRDEALNLHLQYTYTSPLPLITLKRGILVSLGGTNTQQLILVCTNIVEQ